MEYVRYRLDRFDDPRWRKLSSSDTFQSDVESTLLDPSHSVHDIALGICDMESGLYESIGNGLWKVKDIDQYKCFDSSTERVAKHRKDKADHDANRLDLAENNAAAVGAIKPSRVLKLWNEFASVTKTVEGRKIGQIQKLGGDRLTLLLARIREYPTEVEWMRILSMITKRPGLLGYNNRKWVLDFDWLVKPMSIAKLLEGKYDQWGKEEQKEQAVFTGQADDLYK